MTSVFSVTCHLWEPHDHRLPLFTRQKTGFQEPHQWACLSGSVSWGGNETICLPSQVRRFLWGCPGAGCPGPYAEIPRFTSASTWNAVELRDAWRQITELNNPDSLLVHGLWIMSLHLEWSSKHLSGVALSLLPLLCDLIMTDLNFTNNSMCKSDFWG